MTWKTVYPIFFLSKGKSWKIQFEILGDHLVKQNSLHSAVEDLQYVFAVEWNSRFLYVTVSINKNVKLDFVMKSHLCAEAVVHRCSGGSKYFAKFTGKHLCHSLFLKKVAGLFYCIGTEYWDLRGLQLY